MDSIFGLEKVAIKDTIILMEEKSRFPFTVQVILFLQKH